MKRFWIASILGLLFGFVCYGFASSGANEVSSTMALNIILGRMLIGIAIGISRFKLYHWSIHGLVMGFVFSLPAGFGAMMGNNAEMSSSMLLISTIVMGMIYGFLIELICSVIFKAKVNI